MGKDVIIPLDFEDAEKMFAFLDLLGELKPYVKVGMELFYAEGPPVVRELKKRGYKVFLDLKLHDIPNTVMGAMRSLRRLGIDMVNVHASTVAMMEAALEGLTHEDGTRPIIIGVTQLTSTSEQEMRSELLIERSMEEVVARYARNAKKAGLDGVVCSPLETKIVKETCGSDFLTVTPGIRFADARADDQARVTTPESAKEAGSDYIVVGRPITRADDPAAAYKMCVGAFVG